MKRVISCLLTITLLMSLFVNTYAAGISNVDAGKAIFLSDPIPQDAIDYAKSQVGSHVNLLYRATMFRNDEVRTTSVSWENLYLGNGFYKYRLDENKNVYPEEDICFPVYNDTEIILCLLVYKTDKGDWSATCSPQYAKEFSSIKEDGYIYIDQYDEMFVCSDKGLKFICNADNTIDQNEPRQVPELETQAVLSKKLRSLKKELQRRAYKSDALCKINLIPIESARPTKSGGPNGFIENLPNRKIFLLDYCTLPQTDLSGNQNGLCWAASVGTMIRYRTGNRTLTQTKIADDYNVSYSTGVFGLNTPLKVLHDYGETQYQILNAGLGTNVQIMHNINNQFPIYMDVGRKPIAFERHALTIVGYWFDNGTMIIMYWNSGTLSCETTSFLGMNTEVTYNGHQWLWNKTIYIPLN